jgi:alkaline phosphatase
MPKLLRAILLSITLLYNVAAFSQAPDEASRNTAVSQPRQLILIIGDGMDDQQITIARNYLVGAQGQLSLDQLPLRSTSQILTIEDKTDGKPVYVADSANTASSMATGVITSRGRISTTAGGDQDTPTIVELAEAAGYRTGIVTTASVTDATPAAFAAHINFRLCENPKLMRDVTMSGIQLGNCKNDLKANGGKGSISEQLASSGLDVILGGGNKHFTQTAEGDDRSVVQLAEDNGFQVVGTAAELGLANYDQRLLGLFSSGHLPVRLQGEGGRAAEAPEPSILHQLHDYLGDISLPEPMHCEPNPKFSEAPSLKQMTEAALAHLSEGNERGFFLMIESASIDKQAHKRQPCGSIGELEQLEEALRSALDHPL